MILEYHLVNTVSALKLEEEVQKKLVEGWQLYGSPTCTVWQKETHFMQAIVRDFKDNPYHKKID